MSVHLNVKQLIPRYLFVVCLYAFVTGTALGQTPVSPPGHSRDDHAPLLQAGEDVPGPLVPFPLPLHGLSALAFSPDGRSLALGTTDGWLCSWRLADMHPTRCVLSCSEPGGITSLAWLPQGSGLFAGCADGRVRWFALDAARPEQAPSARGGSAEQVNLTDGAQRMDPVSALQRTGRSVAALASPSASRLVAMGGRSSLLRTSEQLTDSVRSIGLAGISDRLLEFVALDQQGKVLAGALVSSPILGLWNTAKGEQKWQTSLSQQVTALALSADGSWLATGHLFGRLSIWDVHNHTEHALPATHERDLRAVALSSDGSLLAAASDDFGVSLWDAARRQLRFQLHESPGVSLLALSPDGRLLAVASPGAGIRIWDTGTGKHLTALHSNLDGPQHMVVSTDRRTLVTTLAGRLVRVWSRQSVADAQAGLAWRPVCVSQLGGSGSIRAVALRPRDDSVWIAHADSGSLTILNAQNCDPLGLTPDLFAGVSRLAFGRTGDLLALGLDDGSVVLWDVVANKARFRQRLHHDQVVALALSERENLVVSAGYDRAVMLTELQGGEWKSRRLTQTEQATRALQFSPDGRWLAMSAGAHVALWEPDKSSPPVTLPLSSPSSVLRFRPDSRQLATVGGTGDVTLWDLDGQRVPQGKSWPSTVTEIVDLAFVGPQHDELAILSPYQVGILELASGHLSAKIWQSRRSWAVLQAGRRLYRHERGDLLWEQHADGSIVPWRLPDRIRPPTLALNVLLDDGLLQHDSIEITTVVSNRSGADGSQAFWLGLSGAYAANNWPWPSSIQLLSSERLAVLPPGKGETLSGTLFVRHHQPSWLPPPPRISLCIGVTLANSPAGSLASVCEGPTARRVVLHVWPIWLQYALTTLAGLLSLSVVLRLLWGAHVRRAGLRHPIVQRVRRGESPLRDLAMAAFPRAEQVLQRADRAEPGLRRSALEQAGIDSHTWLRAVAAASSPGQCAAALANSLGARLSEHPVYVGDDLVAWKIALPPLVINVPGPGDPLLLVCTSQTLPAHAVLSQHTPAELGWPRFALLIDLTTSESSLSPEHMQKAIREAHIGLVLVVLPHDVLRRLVLSRYGEQAKVLLREQIVQQCEIAEIVPYRDGGAIPAEDESFFFGRTQELQRMLGLYRRNFLLIGPRCMGKSSLLNAVCRELRRRQPQVRVLRTQLDIDHLRPLELEDAELCVESPEALYESVMRHTSPYLVFLLDEADGFVEMERSQGYPYCSVMRALHAQGRASFVLAGHQELYRAVNTGDHPLRNFGELLQLEPLDPEAAERMVLEPLSVLGVRFADPRSTVDWLREQTGCRPNVLAVVCGALLRMQPAGSRLRSGRLLSLQDVQTEACRHRTALAAFGSWEGEQIVLFDRVVVRAALLLGQPTRSELLHFLKERGLDVLPDALEQSLTRLYAWHYVLVPDSQGRLRCPVPLFAAWLSNPQPDFAHAQPWPSVQAWLQEQLASDIRLITAAMARAARS